MKKRPDKNSIIPAVVGFVGVIDDAILPPAGTKRCSEKTLYLEPIHQRCKIFTAKASNNARAA